MCSYSTVWFVVSVLGIFPTSEVNFHVCDFLMFVLLFVLLLIFFPPGLNHTFVVQNPICT